MPQYKRRKKRKKNEVREPVVISPLKPNENPVEIQWKQRYKEVRYGNSWPVLPAKHHLPPSPKFVSTHSFSFQGWGCGNFGVLGTGNRNISPIPAVRSLNDTQHGHGNAYLLSYSLTLFVFIGERTPPLQMHFMYHIIAMHLFFSQHVLSPAEFQEENVVVDVNNIDFMQLMQRRAEQFRCDFKVDSGKTLTVYLGLLGLNMYCVCIF